MGTELEPHEASASPSDAKGFAIIAAITIAVAAWLTSQAPQGAAAPTPASESDNAAFPGFRPDAWFLPEDALFGFVEIPEGPFLMGSDPSIDRRAYENERWSAISTRGEVELPTFYIGRYEVTVAQFRAFVEATGFGANAAALDGPADYPVGNVSWPDALRYCRWLEARLTVSPDTPPKLRGLLRDGWRVTLPTEAQWEKAARGADGRIFPWGNEPRQDRANYGGSNAKPVASFECPECPFPLSDMSGNVWELTRSPYRPYPYDPSYDDLDLDADALWVMRGGSYSDPVQNTRAAIRGGADPGARRPFIGFRIVLTRTAY